MRIDQHGALWLLHKTKKTLIKNGAPDDLINYIDGVMHEICLDK